jgi:hypothetical protein
LIENNILQLIRKLMSRSTPTFLDIGTCSGTPYKVFGHCSNTPYLSFGTFNGHVSRVSGPVAMEVEGGMLNPPMSKVSKYGGMLNPPASVKTNYSYRNLIGKTGKIRRAQYIAL